MSEIDMEVDPTDGAKSFKPFPAGEYLLGITDLKLGTTVTSGRKKLDLELTVDEGEYVGRKMWYTLTLIPKGEDGHGFTVQCLQAFGLLAKGETSIHLNRDDFKGRTARANVIIETYEGKSRNKIATAGWITGDEDKQPVLAGTQATTTGAQGKPKSKF
jgi:hypothetical protein